jgi:hypothetical protein
MVCTAPSRNGIEARTGTAVRQRTDITLLRPIRSDIPPKQTDPTDNKNISKYVHLEVQLRVIYNCDGNR